MQLTLPMLLKEAGLSHLIDPLLDKGATMVGFQALLSTNRPRFLAHLRELGVERLGDRQAVANALTKAEKDERLQPQHAIPHLRPCVFEEEDASLTVRLKLASGITSNQLKVKFDVTSVLVELMGERTTLAGKLFAPIKPNDCLWELERAARPEYDPLLSAREQPPPPEDALVMTLVKAMPSKWTTLFVDAMARRFVPPPPPPPAGPPRTAPLEVKKNAQVGVGLVPRKLDLEGPCMYAHVHPHVYGMCMQVGVGFVPRKLDLEGRGRREAEREQRHRQRAHEAERGAALSAKEFWPAAKAQLLWRTGREPQPGAPDHPEESGPLYSWVAESRRARAMRTPLRARAVRVRGATPRVVRARVLQVGGGRAERGAAREHGGRAAAVGAADALHAE